ncbi:3-oxoacyl-[acyl-carrier-protein] synthase III C-terminal domain-containing protein [Rahnella sp. PCH160]|uniref:3-oxoacyl-[acyl-carrier-protein] synthase III C-terminal domain-containing protein n=1 Tax=Rahnella sp. PCH160 TaxID=3447928 RepID=UPI0039FB8B60
MLGHIESLTVYIPEERRSLAEVAPGLHLSPLDIRMFSRFYGLANFPRQPGSLDDLLRPLLKQFTDNHSDLLPHIKHVVHTHTLPSIRPFDHPGKALLDEAGFADDTHYTSLTMGHCSTSLSAVEYVCSRIKAGEYALLLVGEKAFHPKVELIDDTTIMGEAACAILLSRDGEGCKVTARYSMQAGEFSQHRGNELGKESRFASVYFSFIATAMRNALKHFGHTAGSLDWIAPHNVNLSSWQKLADELSIPRQTIFLENVSRYGHCFGADPYLNLATLIRQKRLSPDNNVMLVSVGMGATFSSLLLVLSDGNKIPVFCNLEQFPDI